MDETTKVSILDSSILDDIKKYVGPSISYTVFDMDIIMNINAAFFILFQLGVGPQEKVFTVVDNTATWSSFSDDESIVSIAKQYVYLKVRNVFDPPTSSYVLQAYETQIQELEWRLREQAAGMFKEDEEENGCCCGGDSDPDTDPSDPDEGGTGDQDPSLGYVLPIATSDRLGGVMIGENIHVTEEGKISVDSVVIADEDIASRDDVLNMLDRVFGKE